MTFINHSYLIPILPLVGAIICGLVSFLDVKTSRRFISVVACGAIFISFLMAVGCFYELSQVGPAARSIDLKWFTWLSTQNLSADIAFLIDPLSIVMVLVITGVGFLIHLYSTGYMNVDPAFPRFFSYLNLFCFAMLVLVLANNLLLMFVGWEGVGLCSYLLIGFWYDHKPNATAGMKAFVVNRVGDFGFLIGVLILFWGMYSVGHASVTFKELAANSHLLEGLMIGSVPVVTIICLLLFFGATGKSAQIPLYVWLPDAMAGPTPVSALIHAATMVTAGVYMIGRMNFLFTMSPTALTVVAVVGAVTAFFAATIGFAQDDIKKVLAYSTVSQLGYMFLGMGTGIYSAGIFHLVTHAFFKACLFLGAGCVILSLHHEQDIKKMGGLKPFLPKVYWSFLLATLALSGIFPLSGFFSKDEILWQVFSKAGHEHLFYALWIIGLAGAFATAFYMFRCIVLVFFGKQKKHAEDDHVEADALEKVRVVHDMHQPVVPTDYSKVMTNVVVALAVLSVLGGFLSVPHAIGKFLHIPNLMSDWLAPVLNSSSTPIGRGVLQYAPTNEGHLEYLLMLLSIAVAISGITIASFLYSRRLNTVTSFVNKFKTLHKLVANKYYVDEIYDFLFVKRLLNLNSILKWFDNNIVDGIVNLTGAAGRVWATASGWWDKMFVDGIVNIVAEGTIFAGKKIRTIQTGRIQHYFYIALVGLLIALAWSFAL